jgi:hypothetical protein
MGAEYLGYVPRPESERVFGSGVLSARGEAVVEWVLAPLQVGRNAVCNVSLCRFALTAMSAPPATNPGSAPAATFITSNRSCIRGA